jgi:hypothetical protein
VPGATRDAFERLVPEARRRATPNNSDCDRIVLNTRLARGVDFLKVFDQFRVAVARGLQKPPPDGVPSELVAGLIQLAIAESTVRGHAASAEQRPLGKSAAGPAADAGRSGSRDPRRRTTTTMIRSLSPDRSPTVADSKRCHRAGERFAAAKRRSFHLTARCLMANSGPPSRDALDRHRDRPGTRRQPCRMPPPSFPDSSIAPLCTRPGQQHGDR